MKCHWRKSIQHDCELKLKRTTINIQFVMLSFRSSQFVSCEVSLKRTHDKKRYPNRSQMIQQKLPEKNTGRKDTTTKKTQLFRRLLKKCSHDILIISAFSEKQKNTMAYVGFSFGKCFRLQAPDRNGFTDSKNLVYFFIVESGQP